MALSINTPELNNWALCRRATIGGCGGWNAYVIYDSTLVYTGLTSDDMYIDITDGSPGSGQEWQITLDFPSGASAVGAASSVEVDYNETTYYCDPLSQGVRRPGFSLYPGTVFRLADGDGGRQARASSASANVFASVRMLTHGGSVSEPRPPW